MSFRLFLPLLLFFFAFTSFDGCKKSALDTKPVKKDSTYAEFKIKIVAQFCAYTIVEIQDEEYYSLGMDWEQYKHVFTVENPCDLPAALKVGDVVGCRIIPQPINTSCVVCMGFMETPPLKSSILVIP